MRPMAKSGPAPVIDERRFVPTSLSQARALNRALLEKADASRSEAAGCVMLLMHLDEVERTESVRVQISRYRRLLVQLGTPPWDQDPKESMGAHRASRRYMRRSNTGGIFGRHRAKNRVQEPPALAA